MPRVKRGVTARARHKKVLDQAKGFRGRRKQRLPHRQGSGDEGGAVPVPRPPQEEARVPRALDHPHQRRRARARHDVQRVHDRPEEGRRSTSTARCSPISPCTTRQRLARSRSRPKPLWPDRDPRKRGRRCTASLFFRDSIHDAARSMDDLDRPRRQRARRVRGVHRSCRARERQGALPRQDRRAHRAAEGRSASSPPPSARARARASTRRRRSVEAALHARRDALADAQARRAARRRGARRDAARPRRAAPGGAASASRARRSASRRSSARIGFTVADGPEIEDDFHNFTALQHAREPSGALDAGHVLRRGRHGAAHAHLAGPDPLHGDAHAADQDHRAGPRLSRATSDATHSPMFHQVEGLWIDEDVSFADLKGMITAVPAARSSSATTSRCASGRRSSRSPSRRREIDMAFGDGGWLEIAGSGQVHPNVLRNGRHRSRAVLGLRVRHGPRPPRDAHATA